MDNRLKKICLIIIACLAITCLGLGCTQTEVPKEIVIGVAWPFSTNNDLFNEGIELAVKEINDNGGVKGRELRLQKEDDGAELERGLRIAQSFVDNKEIQAVIGHRNSFISIPAAAIYDQAGLVMLSPASTSPDLIKDEYKHIFRCIPGDDEIARQMALYLAKQGHRRMVIIYSDDSYGIGLANAFEDQAKIQGITIVDRFNNYTGLEDLKRMHSKWLAYGFDGIFIAESMPQAAQFIYDAGQAGISVPFFGGNAMESPSLSTVGGKAAEGTIVGSVFDPNLDSQVVKSFVDSFSQEYRMKPNSYAALGYDAVKILAAAIEKSDLQDRSTVAKKLKLLRSWSGASGIHQFDSDGNDRGDLVVLKQMHAGEFQYLKK